MNYLKKQSQTCPSPLQPPAPFEEQSQSQLTISSGQTFNQEMLPLSDVIGNVDNGFILLHTRKSFYLVDQHAISEKSLYLQMLEEGKVGEEPSDEVVEIENVYGEVVQTERKGLESLGWKYSVVERGKLSTWVRIVRVPSIMGKKSPPSEFVQIVHQLYLSQHQTFTPSQKHTVATIACHNAYRIGDELSHQQMRGLVDCMHNLQGVFNCPHGRPTIIGLGTVDNAIEGIQEKRNYELQ